MGLNDYQVLISLSLLSWLDQDKIENLFTEKISEKPRIKLRAALLRSANATTVLLPNLVKCSYTDYINHPLMKLEFSLISCLLKKVYVLGLLYPANFFLFGLYFLGFILIKFQGSFINCFSLAPTL